MFIYPSTPLQRAKRLLSLLGSFWSSLYDGRELIGRMLLGRAEVEEQNWLNLMGAISSLSRYEVPLFRKENWHLLRLRQSKRYDRLPDFVNETVLTAHAWDLDGSLADVRMICNRLASPSVVLSKNIDFFLEADRSRIYFREDPFDNPAIPSRPVYADGATDQELVLWLFRGDFDLAQVYQHWGYILGLQLESSEGYRDFLNVIFDSLTTGTSRLCLEAAYCIMTGIPVVIEAAEKVQQIDDDSEHTLVITDLNVYALPLGANVTVSEGNILKAGDPLCDSLRVYDFNRGEVPEGLRGLSLSAGFLAADFYGDIFFANQEVPTEISVEDGVTRLEFQLGGFPLDVEAFWNITHARGVTQGNTLAMALRINPNGTTDPENLPSSINPLEFLIQNVLRFNAILVHIKTSAISADGLGFGAADLLRKIIPLGTAVITLIEMPSLEGSVILDEESMIDSWLVAE